MDPVNWSPAFEPRFFSEEVPLVGKVWFRAPTGGERSSAEERRRDKDGQYDPVGSATIPFCLIASAVLKDENTLQWGPADIPEMMKMDSLVFDGLLNAINKNCTVEGLEEAKKNSEQTHSDDDS